MAVNGRRYVSWFILHTTKIKPRGFVNTSIKVVSARYVRTEAENASYWSGLTQTSLRLTVVYPWWINGRADENFPALAFFQFLPPIFGGELCYFLQSFCPTYPGKIPQTSPFTPQKTKNSFINCWWNIRGTWNRGMWVRFWISGFRQQYSTSYWILAGPMFWFFGFPRKPHGGATVNAHEINPY